ncbi:unnamed protein product [Arabidopsis lyrata]|nr:unnamed protein product [Arabidopsis lyrata]
MKKKTVQIRYRLANDATFFQAAFRNRLSLFIEDSFTVIVAILLCLLLACKTKQRRLLLKELQANRSLLAYGRSGTEFLGRGNGPNTRLLRHTLDSRVHEGTEKDCLYLEVELRTFKFIKESFAQNCNDGNNLTLISSFPQTTLKASLIR